jgi:hypothetical protein
LFNTSFFFFFLVMPDVVDTRPTQGYCVPDDDSRKPWGSESIPPVKPLSHSPSELPGRFKLTYGYSFSVKGMSCSLDNLYVSAHRVRATLGHITVSDAIDFLYENKVLEVGLCQYFKLSDFSLGDCALSNATTTLWVEYSDGKPEPEAVL